MTRRPLPGGMPESPECPFCQGRETEIFSTFGSQLSVSTFWCRPCRSPFEFFKWGSERSRPRGGGRPEGGRAHAAGTDTTGPDQGVER